MNVLGGKCLPWVLEGVERLESRKQSFESSGVSRCHSKGWSIEKVSC